jgi:hypothetical protein
MIFLLYAINHGSCATRFRFSAIANAFSFSLFNFSILTFSQPVICANAVNALNRLATIFSWQVMHAPTSGSGPTKRQIVSSIRYSNRAHDEVTSAIAEPQVS